MSEIVWSEKNIYQKLLEVRKHVTYLQKESEGHQYKYVGSSQVLAAVRKKLDEVGLLLTVKVIGHNVLSETVENKDKYDNLKKTTTYFTELDLEYTWINVDYPEEVLVIPFYGQGVDVAGEKGVGKALTYAEKYFMLKQFNIATDKDDPDAFQKKHDNEKETDIPPSTLKAKYQAGKGDMEGFDEWVKEMQEKGHNFKSMEELLAKALLKKAKEEQNHA